MIIRKRFETLRSWGQKNINGLWTLYGESLPTGKAANLDTPSHSPQNSSGDLSDFIHSLETLYSILSSAQAPLSKWLATKEGSEWEQNCLQSMLNSVSSVSVKPAFFNQDEVSTVSELNTGLKGLMLKVLKYGCPLCQNKSGLHNTPNYDVYECISCGAGFTFQWLLTWDGESLQGITSPTKYPDPELEALLPPEPNVINQTQTDPRGYYEWLLEKVVQFREATLNPDRVMTDEEVEQLLADVFAASYQIPLNPEIDPNPVDQGDDLLELEPGPEDVA